MPPTLTVEAMASKHKKKDLIPQHPDLAELVGEWGKGVKPSDHLFLKLARRRTWRMVRLDLERGRIQYENEEGVADFHASGRDTQITELLRNGASLPEAQKLAWHSDIKMTMKYTHIGMADQAKAVANLPSLALQTGRRRGAFVGNTWQTSQAQRKRKPPQMRGFRPCLSASVRAFQHGCKRTPLELYVAGVSAWDDRGPSLVCQIRT